MFVLLEHNTTLADQPSTARADLHWDLLIQTPAQERLLSWRLARNPLETTAEIPATRIQDHHPRFLQFEGKLSRAPGFVRRLDRGPAGVEHLAPDTIAVTLEGQNLRGRFEIGPGHEGQTVFRRAEQQSLEPPPSR